MNSYTLMPIYQSRGDKYLIFRLQGFDTCFRFRGIRSWEDSMAKINSKNKWALFLLILTGIVLGSFLGHLVKDVDFLSWINYGFDFAIGKPDGSGIVSVSLGDIAIHFGLRIRISVGSFLGIIGAIFAYKKL